MAHPVLIAAVFGILCFTVAEQAQNPPSIVIIGAGISGLAAADQLINQHKFQNVAILEASDRIGGRIHPVLVGDTYIQMGAQWLHGRRNPVTTMAVQLGLIPSVDAPMDDIYTKMRFIDQNARDVPQQLRDEFVEFSKESFGKLVDRQFRSTLQPSSSFGAAMDSMYKEFLTKNQSRYGASEIKLLDAMYNASRALIEQYYGIHDWNTLTARDIPESTDDPVNWPMSITMGKDGYKAILDEMTRRVPPSNYVQFNSLVKFIRWNNAKPVELELADGRKIVADHVIVTCPLGHLKNANGLFDPPLPKEKTEAIQELGYGIVDKLFLVFDKPYWPNETMDFNLIRIPHGEPLPWKETALTRSLEVVVATPSSPILMVWIGGHDASITAFENATNDEIADAAAMILRQYFGNPSIPKPVVIRSSWQSNPLFRGSYSYNSIKCVDSIRKRRVLMEPMKILRQDKEVPVILFAGEATNPDHHACVQGAYATGIREAARLSKLYLSAK